MTEFGFIESIKKLFSALPTNSFEGIGDDCAVLPIGEESLLFTSDMLVEDIHFARGAISPYDLGYKSLAVNLSDVAAMGAKPIATLLSLSLPKGLDESWSVEFMKGYHALSQKHNVALVGGDTTSSTSQITINVTAIGKVDNQNIKRRGDAKLGDWICVTGRLGGSAAGLRDLMRGEFTTPNARIHCCPTPRIEEGVWLSHQEGVHAMMDISDGVASDICHISKLSKLGARIDVSLLPTSEDYHTALCGGEDYELLFTLDSACAPHIIGEFNEKFPVSITKIGEIIAGEQIEWMREGAPLGEDLMGFRHF